MVDLAGVWGRRSNLPREICIAVRKLGLRKSRGILSAVQKSAEGKVGKRQAKLLRHSAAEKVEKQLGRAVTSQTEGLNGARKGLKGKASKTSFSWTTSGRRPRWTGLGD